jgi:hypothetical protein
MGQSWKVLGALLSRWGKNPGCRGSRAGGIPPLSVHGRYLTLQLPQPPHPLLLLVPLLRYIINAVPAPSLYLNHSRSLFATHPKEVLVDSCHSLVSFFVFRRDRETNTRKPSSPTQPSQPSPIDAPPPSSDELITNKDKSLHLQPRRQPPPIHRLGRRCLSARPSITRYNHSRSKFLVSLSDTTSIPRSLPLREGERKQEPGTRKEETVFFQRPKEDQGEKSWLARSLSRNQQPSTRSSDQPPVSSTTTQRLSHLADL